MIENLFARTELKSFARQQALGELRKSVRTKDVDEAVAEGWEVLRKNARTVSMRRLKKRSALLESRVWTLLYRMGFTNMSGKGGAFVRIANDEGAPKSQLDVVAIDSEVALCVECKSFEGPKKEPKIQEKLGRLESLRRPFGTAIGKIPPEGKRHIGSVMFTWDVILSETDIARAEEARVNLYDIHDLEYFEALVRLLGPAARYQLLAEVFRGRQIAGLELKVPALRSRMGSLTWYSFAIRPEYLLKIAYIAHRAKGKAIDLDAYQRMISKSRLKKIGEYISAEGVFPTNIVVNVEAEKHLRFDRGKHDGDDEGALFGWLTLTPAYGAAWIIDGQHRLFAYSGHARSASSYLNVLAFAGLNASKQAQLFVDINSEQRRVKRSLLVELDAVLKWDSEDEDKRINAIISRAALALDEEMTSPLRNRLLPSDVQKTDTRCVTLTSLTAALDKPGFFIVARKKGITEYGPLWRNDPAESLKRTTKVLIGWLKPIEAAAAEWWSLGSGEGGGLAMNNGITVCINVLRSVLEHLGQHSRLAMLADDELIDRLGPYAKAVGNHFARMSMDERASFRQLQGVDGQNTGTRLCQAAIQVEFPKFDPLGLKDWIERKKANTNEQARSVIERIEKALQDTVLETLKEEFDQDENQWWYDGVPQKIRTKIQQRIEESDGKAGQREQNFDLVHYREIIKDNWGFFGELFGFGTQGNKDKKTEWIVDVSNMRNTVMHPSRREYLSFEKLSQLNAYWDWMQSQLAKRDQPAGE